MTLRMALAFLVLLALLAIGWSHGLFVKAPAHREVAMAHAGDLERRDFGVAPASDLHASEMHAPTPASIPGGRLLTTRELVDLLQDERTPYVVFDVLGADQALPGAVQAAWMALPGSYDDAVQRRLVRVLERVTRGHPDVALVFYCLSPECWKSYNAALRAIHAGYSRVLWYRGGIEAWMQAGLPTAASVPVAGVPPAALPEAHPPVGVETEAPVASPALHAAPGPEAARAGGAS